jgi:cytochrome c5
LLNAVFFSFVAPIFIIIGLVYYVTSGNKPAAGTVNPEKATAERIQKVGAVEIRDANRALKAGEEVYKAQCAACHAAGAAGAPKVGDAGAWAARIKTGYDALLNSALKGKGAMGAQAGGDFEELEIGVPWCTWPMAAASSPNPSAELQLALRRCSSRQVKVKPLIHPGLRKKAGNPAFLQPGFAAGIQRALCAAARLGL